MKKAIVCFLVYAAISTNAQEDSLLFWQNNRVLSSRYEIVTLGKQFTLLEKYVFFKEHYWLVSRDTFPANYFPGTPVGEDPKLYKTKSKCDSLVNNIKNRASYSKTKGILEDQGGYYAKGCFPNRDWKFFRQTCHEDYLKWESERKEKACRCIDSAASFHLKRMKAVLADTSLLTRQFIRPFLTEGFFSPYPSCYDAIIMAQIIKRKTTVFITLFTAMDKMSFSTFLFKLQDFPASIDTNELKSILENNPIKNRRKKRAIRKIKNVEDNKWCKDV